MEFQIQQSVTASPIVGPVGGYNPSPSAKFPEHFGALIKLSLSDSRTLLKEYGLEAAISEKSIAEEARLDNLNELMSHFGVSSLLPVVLSTISHPLRMFRLVIGCILGQRTRGQ